MEEIFKRKQHVTEASVETKAELVKNSVQALTRNPALSVAEMQKQFVQPIVNAEGKPSAIGEVDRIAREAEKALDELAEYVGQYDSRILAIKEALALVGERTSALEKTAADLYDKLPRVKYVREGE